MEFTYFPFLRQKIGSKWKNQLEIDTPWDIGINKIHAVTERQEIKDVYDLYEICTREKVTIMELVRGVESKFGVQLESRDVIARISYIAKNIESIVPFLVS